MDKWSKLRKLVPLYFKNESMKINSFRVQMESAGVDLTLEGRVTPKIVAGGEALKAPPVKFEGKFSLPKGVFEDNATVDNAQALEAAKRVTQRFEESKALIGNGLRGLNPNTRVDLMDINDVFLINWMKKLKGGAGELEFKVSSKAEDRDMEEMRDCMILDGLHDVDILQKDAIFKLKDGKISRIN